MATTVTRRSLLATLAAILLPKPKALPVDGWTSSAETLQRGDVIRMAVTYAVNPRTVKDAGYEGFPFHFDGVLETQLVSDFQHSIDFYLGAVSTSSTVIDG